MGWKIAICDDDAGQAARLQADVTDWAHGACAVTCFPSAEAFRFAGDTDWDILLLDVEMPGMSGIDLAKRLRGAGCRAEIIFITSHFECMAEGYEVDALHYLVKPVPAEKLRAVLDRAAARLAVEPPSVVIACEEGNVKLYESELLYAESFLHDLVLHTTGPDYRIRESISAFAGRLSADFFRTHRSYLVNLKAVVRIGRTSVLLRGGAEVPLARGKYDAINWRSLTETEDRRNRGNAMLKRTYLRLVEMQEEQARQHLEEVRSIHNEMRGYKHDFHHHLQALKGQLEAGQVDRAIAYLEQLDRSLQTVDTLLKTGNVTVDAILSAKLAQARAAGIAVTAEANLPPELSLTDLELSIVIGNLLDNAIEGCRSAAGEKFLRLSLRMKGDMLYFYLLNSAGKKQKKVGSLFRTGKTGAHGFGLHRAEAIVKQHGGWVKYNSEDGAFTSEFLVPAAC